jgi:hypothetical protein
MAVAGSSRVVQVRVLRSSIWRLPQNDSIIALSKQSPTVPMDPSRPASVTRRVNAHAVNCDP